MATCKCRRKIVAMLLWKRFRFLKWAEVFFFLFLKPFVRSSVSTVVAVLGQINAHVYMGLLETAVSKVKSCVRCSYFHSVFYLG